MASLSTAFFIYMISHVTGACFGGTARRVDDIAETAENGCSGAVCGLCRAFND
jgi:hypothetical protein